MSINELKRTMEFGCDLMFKYNGQGYTILSYSEGVNIGKWNDDDDDSNYKDYEDFIEHHKIGDKYFRDIVSNIEVTFSSGCP